MSPNVMLALLPLAILITDIQYVIKLRKMNANCKLIQIFWFHKCNEYWKPLVGDQWGHPLPKRLIGQEMARKAIGVAPFR